MPLACALICPHKQMFASADIAMVSLPGLEGEAGIRAAHQPFASIVRAGRVRIAETNGSVHDFFVSGGFVATDGKTLTLLAGAAEPLANLDGEKLAQALREAEEDFAARADDANAQRVARLRAQLAALARP